MCTIDLDEAFLTIAELARLLRVSQKTIRAWAQMGILPEPIRLGERTLRFERDAVMRRLRQVGAAVAESEMD